MYTKGIYSLINV